MRGPVAASDLNLPVGLTLLCLVAVRAACDRLDPLAGSRVDFLPVLCPAWGRACARVAAIDGATEARPRTKATKTAMGYELRICGGMGGGSWRILSLFSVSVARVSTQ